jgi:hypothetical protein
LTHRIAGEQVFGSEQFVDSVVVVVLVAIFACSAGLLHGMAQKKYWLGKNRTQK